jgi:hypothetical protein
MVIQMLAATKKTKIDIKELNRPTIKNNPPEPQTPLEKIP